MVNDDKGPPSLLDNEARGGDTAEGGFSFQDNMLVARVPIWLRREGFSEMIREAMGDAEARFFVPGSVASREFVEYKNHLVTPAEFWEEVGRFRRLDESYPNAYERFVLVCRGESKGIQPLLNALRRVRDALPFYSEEEGIRNASFGEFASLVEDAGHSRSEAAFLFSKVVVESDAPAAEKLAGEVFSHALKKHFPGCSRLSGDQMEAAYGKLRSLVKSKKNQPISRAELEIALWSGTPDTIRADREPVRILTASKAINTQRTADLVFQWQEFSGGGERIYPEPKAWERIQVELTSTKEWIVNTGRLRRIHLGGERRLSASLCIGAVFSAASGFSIEMNYRGDTWRTDEYGTPSYAWEVDRVGGGKGKDIGIAIGVSRDIQEDVRKFLVGENRIGGLRLILRSPGPLTGPAETNAAVSVAKELMARELSAAEGSVIHLFVAGPAHFALFLGHRLNALGEVQCYEWTGPGRYTPSCRFST